MILTVNKPAKDLQGNDIQSRTSLLTAESAAKSLSY